MEVGLLQRALGIHVGGAPTRQLPRALCGRDGLHESVLCLGFKSMLVTEMLAEPIRAPIGLTAQTANKVEDILRVVVPDDVLDRLVLGHAAAPPIFPPGITSGRGGDRPAAAGAQVVCAVGSAATRRLRTGDRHRQRLVAGAAHRVCGHPWSHRDGGTSTPALKGCSGSRGRGAQGSREVGGWDGVQLGPASSGGQERFRRVSWARVGGRGVALMDGRVTVLSWVGGVMGGQWNGTLGT